MFIVNLPSLTALLALSTHTLANGIPVVVSPGLNVSSNANVTAHIPSCTNLTNNAPSPYCYTKLQETAYLTNWNLTSPEICAPDELWSTCFLRSIYGKPGPNCTTLTNDTKTCEQYNCTSLSLSSALCPEPTASNATSNATAESAEEWYGAWNLYALQHHIATWSAALAADTSTKAILAAVHPRTPNTATSLLTTLIPKYGLNTSTVADAALVRLLALPTGRPEPAYGNARGRGERSSLSGPQWQVALRTRLGQVLDLAMGRSGDFLGAVEGGGYSARGLASVGNLTRSLRDG
ncbi:hypothetical protein HO173_002542 [Letharia columbiana]|uniref:Uncharacterized protein n=1 Tax=Letharia columbiana TaxID=112416 RepID=A0A8H6G2D2_9LECA|nr:uncharacterized protein HO173_002542 [Letharia columbiana]KAF6239281.1 hypothetical protein HO173_002542 [Letharia columbiana]